MPLPERGTRRPSSPGGSRDMKTLTYAGIGSRVTPAATSCEDMAVIGGLAREDGLASREWRRRRSRYCVRRGRVGRPADAFTCPGAAITGTRGRTAASLTPDELDRLHGRWPRVCIPPGTAARPPPGSLHARNSADSASAFQLDWPVDAVVAFTAGEREISGGTGHGAPHRRRAWDSGAESRRHDSRAMVCERLLAIRRAA